MTTIILIIVLAAVAALLAYASTKPNTFHYERSISIQAPPDKIFPYLNSAKKVSLWSPWEKKDPNMKRDYIGPEDGVGSGVIWDGNKEVGAGKVEIVESVHNQKVVMNLFFYRPMKAHNMAEYKLMPQGDTTLVTWSMYGPNPLIGKIISIVMNCEKMIATEFDKGLATLKSIIENNA